MAVFLGSPPASGENAVPSPFSIVSSTVALPVSLQVVELSAQFVEVININGNSR